MQIKRLLIFVVTLLFVVNTSTSSLSGYYGIDYRRYVPAKGSYGIESIVPESEIKQVTDSTVSPYSAIAFIQADFPSCDGCKEYKDPVTGKVIDMRYKAATGFMISPTCMITAGHVLVCEHSKPVENLRVYFKCTESYNASDPYYDVTPLTASMNVLAGYNGNQIELDAAYVIFDTPYTGTTKYFTLYAAPDKFFNGYSDINVSGHVIRPMYTSAGMPKGLYDEGGHSFYHSASTYGGESGSPVYLSLGNMYAVVGIHTHGYNDGDTTVQFNAAWRITQDFIDLVKDK